MFFIELEPIFNNDGAKQPFDYSLDLSDFAYNGGFPFDKGVKVSGCVKNSTGIVTIEAKAEFTLNLNCDRCAECFSRSFSVPIEHTLVTEVNDETNDELIVVDSFRYDLDPLVTEDIILYLPTKILCKENLEYLPGFPGLFCKGNRFYFILKNYEDLKDIDIRGKIIK